MRRRSRLYLALCSALTLIGVAACSAEGGSLQVVSSGAIATVSATPVPFSANSSAPPSVDAKSTEAVRSVLSQESAVKTLPKDVADDVLKAMRACPYCLMLTGSMTIDDDTYQLVKIISGADSVGYAAFVLRYQPNGKATVALALPGTGISLTVGANNTLVAQEAIYLPNDAMCCASGQSVTIYRYNGSQFIAGDKFSNLNAKEQGSQHGD